MPITIDKGSKYFNTTTYSGTGSNQTITVGFQPDFVWTKRRNAGYSNELQDAVRGSTKVNYSDNTNAEDTTSTNIQSFNSTGYVIGTGAGVNASDGTYVAWNWLANGSGSSNTSGSITSTVSANTTSGFSIVSYTGNGTNGATVGHGLGVTPKMFIIKERTGVNNWAVYHASVDVTAQYTLRLDLTGGSTSANATNNNTAPTSSLITLGTSSLTNGSSKTYIAYCFAEVKGFSKFGSFSGNGSADGTFVYTGFKPAFIVTKITSETGSWFLHDNKRNGYNGGNNYVYPNASDAELTTQLLDITSNGFKMRFAGGANSSGTSIYMAFAESPFVSSKGVAVTAR